MIKSMTGFGRAETVTGECKITVEIKAVNHRYLDLSIKMPKRLNYFEAAMRTLLKDYIQRGKVDVYVTYEDYKDESVSLKYNQTLAGEYARYCCQMSRQFGIENDLTASKLALFPEVFVMEHASEDEGQLWELLREVTGKAAGNLIETRVNEGENLKKDILEKLDNMLGLVSFIEERSPQVVAEYRGKIYEKVKEMLQGAAIDDSRILTEVTIFADKICVDEETVRLRSHIKGMQAELEAGGSVGRKLDFIAQEMNRESNTILSKSSDLAISDRAIVLKTEVEKIREQIQNIE